MTNEELALKIKSGETTLTEQLWIQVEGFIRYMAYRKGSSISDCSVDCDDLYQSGYLAMLKATEGFDAEKGGFTTYLGMILKNAFAEVSGSKTNKQELMRHTISLDAQLESELTLGDTISDDTAVYAFEDAERRIFIEQLKKYMEAALLKLKPEQQELIKRRYFKGETMQSVASSMYLAKETIRQHEINALTELKKPKYKLTKFAYPDSERRLDQRTSFYRNTGLKHYNQTGISCVEETMLWREDQREKSD